MVAVSIVHNEGASRFEAIIDGQLARADYQRSGNVMRIYHTEVPPALTGRGIAGQIVQAALAYAASNGLKVEPLCSYVRAYMRRHPETQALIAS